MELRRVAVPTSCHGRVASLRQYPVAVEAEVYSNFSWREPDGTATAAPSESMKPLPLSSHCRKTPDGLDANTT